MKRESEASYHPLFPPDEDGGGGAAEEELRWILVRRLAPREATAPRRWDPGEATLESIAAAYGGGTYELRGYGARGIVARARYVLDGRSRPMSEDEEPAAPAPAPATAPASAPAVVPSGDGAAMMMQLMAQMMMQQSQQQTQLIVAMMQAAAASSREQIATMQQLHQQHSEAQTRLSATVVDAVGRARGGGGAGEVGALLKGLELGREIQASPRQSPDDALSEIGQIIEAAGPLIEGFAAGRDAPGEAPAPEPEP